MWRDACCFSSGLLCSLVSMASAGAQAGTQVETISAGVFNVAPYVMVGSDGAQGALIEFFDREVAPRMGVRFDWGRPMTTARVEQNLIGGQIMFTPMLIRTAARELARIQFAGEAYIKFAPCIAVLPQHRLTTIRGAADLEGITIGWVQSGAMPPMMQDARIKLDLISNIGWERANLDKLRLGRIGGAYFSNPYTPLYFAARSGMRLRLIGLPVAQLELYGAFAPSAPAELVERYRIAAQEAFAGGRFQPYLNKTLTPPAH